ncbi:MAG TPA: serpin family protein [Candidatus Limnocylindrales bacterium]
MNRPLTNPIARFRAVPGVLWSLGVLALAGAIVTGCAGQAAAIAEATSQAARIPGSATGAAQAAAAIDAFGFDLYAAALKSDGNAVISPASVALALSMAQAGAAGGTASQMDAVLHAAADSGGGNGINSLDQSLDGLSGSFKGPDGTAYQLTLRIANAPFAQRGLALQTPFLDTLASKYGAGLRLVDFQADPAGACKLIDGWVSDQTEGRIPKLLASLDPTTRLVLVNAIYLKAPWQTPFDPSATKNAPFTRSDGSEISVPTMTLDMTEARYASGSGWQAVEIPYVGGSLAMTIVVPDDLAAFEGGLDAARFAQVTTALQTANVNLTLPRFSIETKTDLASALSGMGMPLAFDPDRADFSGITTQEKLFISAVIHQANISVDEKGTEASAATAVVMVASLVPAHSVTLNVNRPFLYAVRDTSTGAILFLGRVVDPSV